MKISGLQKTTLIDYPGKIACTLFLHGCNLRCGFCHNPNLVIKSPEMNYKEEEILAFLKNRKNKLSGVCITGGEPLLNLNLDFVKKIKSMGYSIKIDTNGCYPLELKKLIDSELVDYVALDIKACKKNYNSIVGTNSDIKKIEQSMLLVSKLDDYEFRTTVIESIHDKQEIVKIGKWVYKTTGKKPKKYYLQAFTKRNVLVDVGFKDEPNTTKEYLLELKESVKDFFEQVEIRN